MFHAGSSGGSRRDRVKTAPVGLCIRSTAVSTLLTFWPPAPPDRAVDISMSCHSSNVTLSDSKVPQHDACHSERGFS